MEQQPATLADLAAALSNKATGPYGLNPPTLEESTQLLAKWGVTSPLTERVTFWLKDGKPHRWEVSARDLTEEDREALRSQQPATESQAPQTETA
jgi:hypothetical protein